MKNDYLWDKTGNDTEIEKLENALKVFRIEETKAPQIPDNIIYFNQETPRNLFSFFRALAAGFAFASALIVAGFIYFNSETETAQHKTIENSIQSEELKIQKPTDFIQPEKTVIEQTSIKEKSNNNFENPKTGKQNFKVQKLIYKPKAKALKVQKTEVVKLTEEEKEAYDKLMLALSITSSKLKIVKDKVQNLDEQTAINTENKKYTRKK